MSENRQELTSDEKVDLIGKLLKKAADTKRVEEETGKSTKAATTETLRQIRQVLKNNIITKSGEED